MDRTVIAPWKAEEKEQSEKLYKKLQGLSLLYPMNEEMLKLFSWDIFLKPNQPAFFQVMHYLFRILDPAEFKRRFFWPITDKKSEANFRSSTIDYLKHLNEKHTLNWTNIKSYLVVMPGGMKFINFMLDLVGFVVQELIKQREKSLNLELDVSEYRNRSAQWMLEKCAFRKEYASAYIEELKANETMLRDRTCKIRQKYTEIARETNVEEALLLGNNFLKDFKAHNRNKCEQKITLPAGRIAMLEGPLCAQKEAMDQFQEKRAEHTQNKAAADKALCDIQKLFGSESVNAAGTTNALLSGFNNISETIAEQLDSNDHYSECNEAVTTDLEALRAELQQIDVQVTELQRNLNTRANSNNSGNVSQTQSSQVAVPSTPLRTDYRTQAGATMHPLLSKFVFTPPIRPELPSGVRNVHVRLPLMDDFNAKQFETTCSSLLAPAPPRSSRKIKPQQEQASELSNTMNRSKIVDPMQLLRTINKRSDKPNSQLNLSSLGSKWKQMQASFGFDDATPAVPISPMPNAASSYSPFTPLNCNELTRIERLARPSPPPVADINDSSLYSKKNSALMKVMEVSLNVQSTSPSGRLDALLVGPLPEQQVTPRLLLNDQALNISQELECSSKGNCANQLNKLPSKFCLDISYSADNEDLQNISDTVLKDISI